MKYKGYAAHVEFDPQDRIFSARIMGIKAIVTFHRATVDGLENAFQEAVDHYLEICAEVGDEPNKPYTGKLTLRIDPGTHAAIANAAQVNGKSINKWITDVLDRATGSC